MGCGAWPAPRRAHAGAAAPLALLRGAGAGAARIGALADLDYPLADEAALGAMLRCSPSARGVAGVGAAVLVMLGLADRRVPPSQGLEMYYVLKAARGGEPGSAPVRALSYPLDSHALDKPGTEADAWLNIARFLDENGA
jgi:hypothetical protein